MKTPKLKAEWELPKGLALVYPERLPKVSGEPQKEKLITFYDDFIHVIIDNVEIEELTIIHKRGLKEKLRKDFPSSKINPVEINYVQDIWIRDWAPIVATKDKSIKARYLPQYYASNEKWDAKQDDNAGIYLAKDKLQIKITCLTYRTHKLILDGGNFAHNGNGIGIVSNRIIGDNENLSIDEIKETFRKQLGIIKLIIVPVEPGDNTGHVDCND